MSGPRTASDYHPRWYRPYISTYWWLERRSYFAFIMRELSSIFVAWGVIYLLLLIRAVSRGGGATRYQEFLAWSVNPVVLAINVVTLGFVVYHAITWFNLSPQAMVVRIRGKRVPPFWIIASNYLACIVISAAILWLVLGGGS